LQTFWLPAASRLHRAILEIASDAFEAKKEKGRGAPKMCFVDIPWIVNSVVKRKLCWDIILILHKLSPVGGAKSFIGHLSEDTADNER
jgi:hypothetical protein